MYTLTGCRAVLPYRGLNRRTRLRERLVSRPGRCLAHFEAMALRRTTGKIYFT